jgi:hypothetical protein
VFSPQVTAGNGAVPVVMAGSNRRRRKFSGKALVQREKLKSNLLRLRRLAAQRRPDWDSKFAAPALKEYAAAYWSRTAASRLITAIWRETSRDAPLWREPIAVKPCRQVHGLADGRPRRLSDFPRLAVNPRGLPHSRGHSRQCVGRKDKGLLFSD